MNRLYSFIAKAFSYFSKKIADSKFGKKVRLGSYCSVSHSYLHDYVNITSDVRIQYSNIGKRTSIGTNTRVNYAEIGSYCSIGWNVTIGALPHPIDRISGHAFTFQSIFGIVKKDNKDVWIERPRTKVGNDVWIGCNAVIKAGINVGNGCVIGAGAIVLKDVPDYAIVVGVPATIIKYRFSESVIQRLQQLQWWNLSDDILKENIDLFTTNLSDDKLNLLESISK